jgi:hypothetical protein
MSAAQREEREQALKIANAKMRDYHINRPPLELIEASRRRSKQRDAEHRMQFMLGE